MNKSLQVYTSKIFVKLNIVRGKKKLVAKKKSSQKSLRGFFFKAYIFTTCPLLHRAAMQCRAAFPAALNYFQLKKLVQY